MSYTPNGGQYNSIPPTLTNGQTSIIQLDASANLMETLATTIAGEDITNDVLKVETRGSYLNITTATTTTVKSGPGELYAIIINTPVASSVITIYDNTAGSGTKIGTITLPATLVSDGPISTTYNVAYTVGLTIVTATAASDITVSYR